jgi:hypothetical protein
VPQGREIDERNIQSLEARFASVETDVKVMLAQLGGASRGPEK